MRVDDPDEVGVGCIDQEVSGAEIVVAEAPTITVSASLTRTFLYGYVVCMARVRTTADVFNAVGDPCRRRILGLLAQREATVGELVGGLGLGQPQVSKHLRVLREVGLVRFRADGARRLYRVHPPAFAPLRGWLDELTDTINANYDRLDDYLVELQAERD